MPYADVILPLPVKRTFTYHVPKDLAGIIAIGKRVRVPLGLTRNYTAIVARLHDEEIPNVDVFIKAYINEDVSEIDSKYHYIIDGSGDKEDTNQYIVTYKI